MKQEAGYSSSITDSRLGTYYLKCYQNNCSVNLEMNEKFDYSFQPKLSHFLRDSGTWKCCSAVEEQFGMVCALTLHLIPAKVENRGGKFQGWVRNTVH